LVIIVVDMEEANKTLDPEEAMRRMIEAQEKRKRDSTAKAGGKKGVKWHGTRTPMEGDVHKQGRKRKTAGDTLEGYSFGQVRVIGDRPKQPGEGL
jgi:hypothetical protein